jgi:hypothetical protein
MVVSPYGATGYVRAPATTLRHRKPGLVRVNQDQDQDNKNQEHTTQPQARRGKDHQGRCHPTWRPKGR